MFKNLNGRPIFQRCVDDHAHDAAWTTVRASRDNDGQTRKDWPKIPFVAGQNTIKPRCECTNQNVRQRTFEDPRGATGHDVTMPGAVGFLGVALRPGFRPHDAEVEQKLVLGRLVAVENWSKPTYVTGQSVMPSGRLASRSLADETPKVGSASATSISRQVSTTQAITHALRRGVPPSTLP